MIEIDETELVFAFPEVDEEASLRIHFSSPDLPEEPINIKESPRGGIQLAKAGRFVIWLRPDFSRRDRLYRETRYPFVVQVSVGGKNAITGDFATDLVRSPQNYFSTPPQGAIDGFFFGGQVHPFRADEEMAMNHVPLQLTVIPMKSKAFAYLKGQLQLIPGPGPSALRGITLLHGGQRQCEPIYEDICNLGSWSKGSELRMIVWLSGKI